MIEDDKAYMSDILAAFKVQKYKLSETETRFKLIVHPTEPFDMKVIHNIQDLRGPVGVEVDIQNGVYLDCLKTGASRKKRRIQLNTFNGPLPKKYDVGKFNGAMRELLSVEDVCAFDTRLDGDVLTITNLETVSYPLLKKLEASGCSVEINMTTSQLILKI